jgi:nicotinamide-nucleotide amidase
MNAELIAVGTELLRYGRADTNGDWLTEQLHRAGIEVTARAVVDDEEVRIASVIEAALRRADVVLLTGGLGPTVDDRTRKALARATASPLESDPAASAALEQRFRDIGRPFGEGQRRQATRPAGAVMLANRLGTAPGILMRVDAKLVAAFPGVPGEMKAMFLESVLPDLAARAPRSLARLTLKIAGRSEPDLDEALLDLDDHGDLSVTILSGPEGLELHLRIYGDDETATETRLREMSTELCARLGDDVYGADDDTLATVVGRLLAGRGWTLASAESCTAGLLGAAITDVPGSSAWYRGGFVCYDNELKQSLAGVEASTLERHGAVSEEVARELARGARERCGADVGVGITGIAGPDGGTAEKPVGLVHVAIDFRDGHSIHRRCRFGGDRETVRRRTVTEVLDRLRRDLG